MGGREVAASWRTTAGALAPGTPRRGLARRSKAGRLDPAGLERGAGAARLRSLAVRLLAEGRRRGTRPTVAPSSSRRNYLAREELK